MSRGILPITTVAVAGAIAVGLWPSPSTPSWPRSGDRVAPNRGVLPRRPASFLREDSLRQTRSHPSTAAEFPAA